MVELNEVEFVGSGLKRPECVLCHRSGRLFVSDCTGAGGVTVVETDGRIHRILA